LFTSKIHDKNLRQFYIFIYKLYIYPTTPLVKDSRKCFSFTRKCRLNCFSIYNKILWDISWQDPAAWFSIKDIYLRYSVGFTKPKSSVHHVEQMSLYYQNNIQTCCSSTLSSRVLDGEKFFLEVILCSIF